MEECHPYQAKCLVRVHVSTRVLLDQQLKLGAGRNRLSQLLSSEQHICDGQGHDDIKTLRDQEGIQGFSAGRMEQIGELGFQSDAGKGQGKPESLQVFQPPFDRIDGTGGKEKGEEERSGQEANHEFGEPLPYHFQSRLRLFGRFRIVFGVGPIHTDRESG